MLSCDDLNLHKHILKAKPDGMNYKIFASLLKL